MKSAKTEKEMARLLQVIPELGLVKEHQRQVKVEKRQLQNQFQDEDGESGSNAGGAGSVDDVGREEQ